MQLLLEHSQHGKVFRLGAKYELSEQEHTLVERYGIKRFVLVEGDQRAEWNLALKLAGVVALVLFAILLSIAMEHFGPVAFVSALPIPIFVFPIAAFLIYRRIRETITVEDILEGRHFSCRSIVTLLEKKQQISEMGEKLRAFCSFSRIGEDGRSLRWRLTGRQLPGLWRGPRQPNINLPTL